MSQSILVLYKEETSRKVAISTQISSQRTIGSKASALSARSGIRVAEAYERGAPLRRRAAEATKVFAGEQLFMKSAGPCLFSELKY